MTTLIIARHGNTFEDGETPRRVGRRTDLPLTEKGREQARAIGVWLRDNSLIPDAVYSSTLKRTIETATLAIEASGVRQPVFQLSIFDEIDYGLDENKTEDEVIARVGMDALAAWDRDGLVPNGWLADTAAIIGNWQKFGDSVNAHEDNETILVVTSNGIARFAPQMTGTANLDRPKLSTGAFGVLKCRNGLWTIDAWNVR